MSFVKILLKTFFVLFFCKASHQQAAIECCGLKMLDSQNSVAIEVDRPLDQGSFRAMIVKACTIEPFEVQVWSRITQDRYVLKWSVKVNPTSLQVSQREFLVSFVNPLSINSNDRLGLYSPGNAYNKISVPYTYSSSSSIRLSSRNFVYPFDIPLGTTLDLSRSSWPRTFEGFVSFCSSPNNCPTLSYTVDPTPETSFSKYITIPSFCCDPDRLPNCDITNRTMIILNEQTNIINVLIDRINYLKILIKNYIEGINELGYCEDPTYKKGLYGLGHCYKVFKQEVELAEAAILCSADKARVVFIKDQFEDNFVRTMLLDSYKDEKPPQNSVKSWIAAIFNFENTNKEWYWYNNLLPGDNLESFGSYVKWLRGITPVPDNKGDVCSTYELNTETNAYFWKKETCTSKHPFICKIKKLCY